MLLRQTSFSSCRIPMSKDPGNGRFLRCLTMKKLADHSPLCEALMYIHKDLSAKGTYDVLCQNRQHVLFCVVMHRVFSAHDVGVCTMVCCVHL